MVPVRSSPVQSSILQKLSVPTDRLTENLSIFKGQSNILIVATVTLKGTNNHANITGFQFMANKQLRMEKKLGTSVCADISHQLSKTNTFNFYKKKSFNKKNLDEIFCFFCRFLDQIRLQKTVFWSNIKKMFFSIQ